MVWLVCLPLLAAGAGAAVLSAWPALQRTGPLALAASFAPLGAVCAVAAAVLLLVLVVLGRPRRLAGAGLLLSLALVVPPVAPAVPPLLAGPQPVGEHRLTVVSLNMLSGQADPESIARAAAGADVLVLVEVLPDALEAVLATDVGTDFPHRGGAAQDGYSGTLVLSRHPVETVEVLDLSFQQRLVRLDVPGIGPVHLLAAHPINPLAGTGIWEREHRQLLELATGVGRGPVVVAGDLNAVDQHVVMQAWRQAGFTDVAHSAGAGWVRTWPADRRFPPVIGIDHVLTGPGLTGVELSTFWVPGTDHLGLRAVLAPTTTD